MPEYASYLDPSRFTDMHGSDRALTVRDLHNILHNDELGSVSNFDYIAVGVACLCF